MAKAKKSKKDSTELLRRRLKDLSRELEIEAALEKVRSKAMSMRTSDMLAGTSAVMFQQIKTLGIDATRCGVGIFDDANDAMEVWLTTASAGDKVMRVLDYVNLHIHPVYENILAARKKKKPYAITVLQGEEVRNYYNTMSVYMAGTGRRVVNKEEAYQSFFFDQGTINITTASPLNEEERSIMVRFAKVFGLIYLRFVDLQKAEAQASEARIEASLERVRSRSLAMRKSVELSDVAVILYKELRLLGVTNFFNCGYVEVDTQANIQYGWMTLPKGKRVEEFKLPLVGDPVLQERYEAWQRKDPVFYQSVGGTELKEHLNFVRPTIDSNDVDKKVTTRLPDPTVFYAFNFSHGYLHLISDGLLNADEELLATRFAKVFEIAYRRFLDLKVAEAQAQEAQIEAALERIRSRSLAMQRSEELMEVADVLREQMVMLGQAELETSALHFYKEVPGHIVSWRAFRLGSKTKGKISKGRMLIPNDACAMVAEWLSNFNQGLQEYTMEVSGAKQQDWYNVLFRLAPEVGEAMVKQKATTETRYYHFSRFSGGALLMVAIKKPSEESIYLQRRAASVLDLAYRRFVDLKVAEAQAREAQIEAALEKIRSHSLAMQRSEQLREVIRVMMEQFSKLGIPADLANFNFYTRTNDWSMWLARPGFAYAEKIHLPYIQHPLFDAPVKSALKGATLYSDVLTRAEGRSAMKHFLRYTLVGKDPEAVASMKKAKGLARSIVFGSKIMLTISRYDAIPYDEEQNSILTRFANVFEQAYTRFLDLQKAETQAREAQIELALERIRARTMAMQKSEELAETAYVYFQQFKELGQSPEQFTIGLINETKRVIEFWHTWQGSLLEGKVEISIDEPHVGQKIYNTWKGEQRSATIDLSGKELRAYNTYRKKQLAKANAKAPAEVLRSEKRRIIHIARFSKGTISVTTHEPQPAETFHLLERFANVFDQTYTRFLDLQRAEAQAREAQIEAALERVRASMMAMHSSDGLPETMKVIAEQLTLLGVRMESVSFLPVSTRKDLTMWSANAQRPYPIQLTVPYFDHPVFHIILQGMADGSDFKAFSLSAEENRRWWMHFFSVPEISHVASEERKAYLLNGKSFSSSIVFRKNISLNINNYQNFHFSDEENSILKRFANVFEQAYVRFQDIQRAEAQAREAQIEAALERVRASTMAMHKSEQLLETAKILFEQFGQLGKTPDRIGIGIMREEKEVVEWWVTHQKGTQATHLFESSIRQPTIARFFGAWKAGSDSITVQLEGTELKEWIRFVREDVKMPLDDSQMKGKRVHHAAFFTHGLLLISHHDHFPEETMQLLIRFAKVFGQTYTRFLDLQKAEAQAREAQLETALERVRSRSLAMHKSTEIEDVVAVVFTQLQQLGLNFEVIGIATRVENTNDLMCWIGNDQHSYANRFLLPYTDFGAGRDILAAMDDKAPFFSKVYSFEEKNRFWSHAFANSGFKGLPEARKQYILQSPSFSLSVAPVNGVVLLLIDYSGKVATEQESELVKRFARVFEQCYVRFQDLEKVEAQAREATIQASLERVRAKAMAMHSSQDLAETIYTFYSELVSLNLAPRRAGLGLINKETRVTEISTMSTTEAGISVEVIGELLLENHPVLEGVYEHWLRQAEYHPVLRGNEIKQYFQVLRKNLAFPDYPNDAVQFGYFFFFEEGGIYAWTDKELQEDELNIYRRFTSVLSLTYKRYKDLKDSEARAKEAVKQASLDRVRAEIASMRHADDLQRITPLIWRELTTLGVPFFRCGVMIVHEKEHHVDFYLSTPEGRPLAALHLDSNGQEVTKKAMDHWRRQAVYTDHWDREQFAAFAQDMVKAGQVQNASAYQGGEPPPESMTLQFSPFAQGMLYVGSEHPLSTEQLELVHALADAFSTAYARYEDFTRLEAAKATVERALSELRTTQNQLVQSEKMASLGELTAGIAHEIQNPLNFVNNFSEVSKELLEEMEAELKKGNSEDAVQIAKDIIQNLEKINFHGKRADGIVKSMLQHSRKSTGQKELTDINALCDEYLRLAYHGLRAKDKSFNAKFETSFDPSVGQISVLPQEIGRVVLNLINNAFYAVSEKKKLNLNGYEPTVTVTTKKTADKIEIQVKDNGTGIPQKALDKIFQPFFTTKPTGQGTGLGLSLSYDIVKVHGGQLTVETAEGSGTTFTILLNASS